MAGASTVSAVGTTELGRWSPLEADEVVRLFRPAAFRWWLAGGHALEAHFETSWRDHEDIDVGIARADAPQLFDLLSGWEIQLASDGALLPWDGRSLDESSDAAGNLWCRPSPEAPWALDVLLGEGDNTEWIYRRDQTVRRRWSETVLRTASDVPYLAPEIQLLFKSKDIRAKDQADAVASIPQLTTAQRGWLAEHLSADHPWQTLVAGHRARLALDQSSMADVPITPLAAGRSSQAWQSPNGGVARVPIPNSGRLLSYRSESLVGQLLADAGHPVSRWETRSVDSCEVSVGRLLNGSPIAYGAQWGQPFTLRLASVLSALHNIPASGWGPLANTSNEVRGTSGSETQGIIDRWFHAPIWPFDGSDFSTHPIHTSEPDLGSMIAGLKGEILAAAGAPIGVVHSDLHNQHLLHEDGELTGLLDFGDAFIGAVAWDFALVIWYYGGDNAALFANAYQASADLLERGETLAIAVGCYKVAKNPDDPAVGKRLRALLLPHSTS